jgi:hypothetical protein
MEILQPILLWGLLGLTIPLAIHLWNGKKGKNVAWAAMAWLSEQENQSSKSIRLDQILVLILRMILLVLFVLLLSYLILNSWEISESKKVVHLVAPDQQVFEEFRFELEQADEREEEVAWMERELTEISEEIESAWYSSHEIQKALNSLEGPIAELHLYLPNSENYLPEKMLISPVKPIIHLAKTASGPGKNFGIELDSARILEIGNDGLLVSQSELGNKAAIISLKQVGFYLGNLEEEERENVKASLNSISQVMKIYFVEKENPEGAILVFNQGDFENYDADKLFFLTERSGFPEAENVNLIPSKLDFESSELVQTGRLPEFLLGRLIDFVGVKTQDSKISETQLSSRFLINEKQRNEKKSGLEILLVSLFVLTFGAERYLSFLRGI